MCINDDIIKTNITFVEKKYKHYLRNANKIVIRPPRTEKYGKKNYVKKLKVTINYLKKL